MVDKIAQFKSKARHVGTFDFKETYRITYEWLVDQGYDIHELYYKEVVGSGGAKEVDIRWIATKPISDYFRFSIAIWFHPLAMTSVEVEIDGVKQKINKGDFTIEINSALEKDYADEWGQNNFLKSLKKIYNMHLVKERTEQYEGQLIAELDALIEYIKSFWSLTGKRVLSAI